MSEPTTTDEAPQCAECFEYMEPGEEADRMRECPEEGPHGWICDACEEWIKSGEMARACDRLVMLEGMG